MCLGEINQVMLEHRKNEFYLVTTVQGYTDDLEEERGRS